MAELNARPTIDLAAGREVLAATLPRVLKSLGAADLPSLGWRQPNENTLLVPLTVAHEGKEDIYLLRLRFLTAGDWPPSAQFVNPDTLDYEIGRDERHLPKLTSPACRTHSAYTAPDQRKLQLVCCSATFEFYDVLHSLDHPDLIWKKGDTFLVTLSAIQSSMATHYEGSFAPP